jgi:hypothetical protein
MRIKTAAICLALAGTFLGSAPAIMSQALAQTAPSGMRVAQAASAPEAAPPHRPLRRLRIYPRYEAAPDEDVYPRYNPGPNAVRDCNATYVEEHRPSGTVIVPRMHCFWRPG